MQHYAARNGKLEACRILVSHGANVNAKTRAGGATSLMRAVMRNHLDVVCVNHDPHSYDSGNNKEARIVSYQWYN